MDYLISVIENIAIKFIYLEHLTSKFLSLPTDPHFDIPGKQTENDIIGKKKDACRFFLQKNLQSPFFKLSLLPL